MDYVERQIQERDIAARWVMHDIRACTMCVGEEWGDVVMIKNYDIIDVSFHSNILVWLARRKLNQ